MSWEDVSSIVVAIGIVLFVSIAIWVFGRHQKRQPGDSGALFVALLCLCMLGIVCGQVSGQSREPAVQTVIPAVLTLIGSVLVYLVGVHGIATQRSVSGLILGFTFCFFVGIHLGAENRAIYDSEVQDKNYLAAQAVAAQHARHMAELQRLSDNVELFEFASALVVQGKLPANYDPFSQDTKRPSTNAEAADSTPK